MKSSLFTLVLASSLGVRALDSLSGYTKNIPKCAYSALVDGMKHENCDISQVTSEDFDCLCKHSAAISVIVAKSVDTTCIADFAQAVGSICGRWMFEGTSATDLAAATSALADALNGKGPDAKPTATGTGTGAGASTSATKNIAHAHTAGVIGYAAAAAAAAVVGIVA